MKSATDTYLNETNIVAFLSALCLFLSLIEYIIPKPVPFMRIGIANLPVLLGIYILKPGKVLLLIFIKVLGQGLIQGTLLSYVFIFSFFGSFASGIVMLLLHGILKNYISLIGLSISGALASNLVQVLLAVLFIFGSSGWIIAFPVLIIGFISSCVLGFFAEFFYNKSRWVREIVRL